MIAVFVLYGVTVASVLGAAHVLRGAVRDLRVAEARLALLEYRTAMLEAGFSSDHT